MNEHNEIKGRMIAPGIPGRSWVNTPHGSLEITLSNEDLKLFAERVFVQAFMKSQDYGPGNQEILEGVAAHVFNKKWDIGDF